LKDDIVARLCLLAGTALGGNWIGEAAMSEFERWDKRFAAADYVFGEAPNAFLSRQKLLLPKSGKALAVADGEGRNGVWLAEQGLEVVSMDFSPNAQAKARTLAAKRGVSITTELGDLLAYPWPAAAYDVIAAVFIQIMGPADRAVVFAGIREALKPGGLLLLEGYTAKQIQFGTGGPKAPEDMYSRELLSEEFGHLQECRIDEYEVELNEGSGHGGMSAVIDLVARK
jgi:SAM-dependent methyltransferase